MSFSDSGEDSRRNDMRQKGIRLNEVLASLKAKTLKERTDAMKGLKETFDRPQKSSNIGVLTDKSYHDIFENLFNAALAEKRLHNQTGRAGQKTALLRLVLCADTIFTVVRAGTSKLRKKTVKAVCQHVIQTLPTSEGTYCEEIAQSYLKSLCVLFEYKPHAEQVKSDLWEGLIDFCLAGINQYLEENTGEPPGLSRSFSGLGSSSSAANANSSSRNGSISRQNVEDLFQIVLHLISAPNAPIVKRYEELVDSTMRFLQLPNSSMGQVHQLAFSTLNAMLLFVRSDRVSLSLSISQKVVPVIIRLWQGRAVAKDEMINSVRDEMMILLVHIHPHLENLVTEGTDCDLWTRLEDLADVLREDYEKRSGRDQLHLDDLEMIDIGLEALDHRPFSLGIFRLRPFILRAERNWTHLQLIGIIERLLRLGKQINIRDEDPEAGDHDNRRKRQKISSVSDRLIDPLLANNEDSKVAGLQILPFVLHNCQLSTEELSILVRRLHICALDKRGNVASWALLAIASCTYQLNAARISSLDWIQSWQTGTRALTFAATSRTAGVQLHSLLARGLVLFHDIAEDVNAIVTSTDTNGPAILSDSSMTLMTHLLHARVTEVPGSSLSASQHVIRWLFSKWTPDNKSYAMHEAIHVSPLDFTTLLRTCLGLHRCKVTWKAKLPWGVLGQAWQNYLDTQPAICYLLLVDTSESSKESVPCLSCPKYVTSESDVSLSDSAHFHSIRKLVLELLLPKLTAMVSSWQNSTTDRATPVSSSVYSCAVHSCLTVLLSMKHYANIQSQQVYELQNGITEFSEGILSFLKSSKSKGSRDMAKEAQALLETLLQAVQPFLPGCELTEITLLAQEEPHMLKFFNLIAEGCVHRPETSQSRLSADADLMDVDDDYSTPNSQGISAEARQDFPRHEIGLEMDFTAFHLLVSGRLILLAEIDKNREFSGLVPSSFYTHLTSLSQEDLISSRRLVVDVLSSELMTSDMDADDFLGHILEMMQSYSWNQCEVFMAMCLDTLVSLGPRWSSNVTMEAIRANALEGYRWFIESALGKDIASPEIQKRIAQLLLLLLQIQPEYGVAIHLPSPRSSLFSILAKGNISVKFYVASRLPDIFGNFLLENHDKLFVDILELLPSDPDRMEGISFRMFVLARLASRWSNLLRRCIYHIFEIPGRVPGAVKHASKCLEDVASSLEVDGPREIFDLFAPQLLFTWTENDKIQDIPFEIFGFSSLKDLVLMAQEELVGLMAMRGNDEEVQNIAAILALDHSTLLQNSFPKVMAYCIAQDSKSVKASVTKGAATLESRVRTTLGQELFFKLLNQHFVEIVALLFHIMDQETEVEKYFERSKDFKYASEALSSIKKLSSSKTALPANQQPLFGSKTFPAQILLLCSRTAHTHNTLYTRTLVTYMARKLLNAMHPALGSLHSCSILRKLRILVSLAGGSALEGYPLEMILQAARMFLVDPECADDAIGLVKYLLTRGAPHLLKNPSFVAGLGLSYLGSLRIFLQSSQSSTTQESQFLTTMSAAQKFRKWFGEYLAGYESPGLRTELKNSFRKLTQAAYETEPIGNADTNSEENNLLLQLLKDEHNGGSLLNQSSRKLALGMLCAEFRLPTSFRDDFLGSDEDSTVHAAVVWKSCMGQAVSDNYISWAARVLGRAFTASGHVRDELLQESNMRSFENSTGARGGSSDSRSTILRIVQDLTLDAQQTTVGLGESALRSILSNSEESVASTYHTTLSPHLYSASFWKPYHVPPSEVLSGMVQLLEPDATIRPEAILDHDWLRDLSICLVQSVSDDCLLMALVPILRGVAGFAERVFPFVLHLALSAPIENRNISKKHLSKAFNDWLGPDTESSSHNLKVILNAILYLRTQSVPGEKSSAQRARWLDIDYLTAAKSATSCGMHKTALLFVEDTVSEPAKSSRRSSMITDSPNIPNEVLLTIFENIDDPDLYYGVQQPATLESILARFEYEKDGPKSLAFRGAQFDSHIRRGTEGTSQDLSSLVKSLDILSLSGVSHSLLQSQQSVGMTATSLDSMFRTARKLEQWDIPVPPAHNSNTITLYKAFQAIHTSSDRSQITTALNEGLERTMRNLVRGNLSANALHESLQTLASLTEMDEILSSQSSEEFEVLLSRFQERSEWMKTGRFDDITAILSCRGTTLSTVSKLQKLQNIMGVPLLDTRVVEVKAALLSSKLNRAHNALQESLSLATSMIDLIKPCAEVGLKVGVSIQAEAANTLWDQGEMASSISMLQTLDNTAILKEQTISVGRSELLWKIGYQVSVARLETPDRIIEKYLVPSLKELKGKTKGSDAGQVFHQFAVFCDQQLQDPGSLEDLERLQRLRRNKADEVEQYKKLIKSTPSETKRRTFTKLKDKAETWLNIDEKELQRQNANREEFLRQCLENYLLALSASDDHDSNALRFSNLWLGNSENQTSNNAVLSHLSEVPSRKFARLMNQLTSRLQDNPSPFQKLLYDLVRRICQEHPYHGMYQIYSSTKTIPNKQDESATSRYKTTLRLTKDFMSVGSVAQIWRAINLTNDGYCQLAAESNAEYKQGRKFLLTFSVAAEKLQGLLHKYPVPSPTMNIPLAANLDYSNVPKMRKFDGQFTIAGGVSSPKILTAIAGNGSRFKQLVKGGNDDLRQDAIMEQVFEQVSELLKTNRSTRQRNLTIRTYKVLPLSASAGVIEFVANTKPLHDYLIPAHERYNPKDLKAGDCRRKIMDVQNKSVETRIAEFRNVTRKFQPVMRYFFTENFTDPDDWFARRLAYTRSTAAISILGHVLGLGDRHGQNILLDEKSGEVVHIDLGIAFEMGRVLQVPEIVPFRLTRDIVDGMGITKTEGVFRRCCEFTLEALRKEAYSIMTILDVLRYDPLYSWSISPVRLAKLQEEQSALPQIQVDNANEPARRSVNEPGEADRALTVVNKKLSKTLSVTATVHDLINQASDERNLALLFGGWAAYA